jgi:hypothetical protein
LGSREIATRTDCDLGVPGSATAEAVEPAGARDGAHRPFIDESFVTVKSKPDDVDAVIPSVGIVVMGRDKRHIRVFGVPQTPASEVLRRPGLDALRSTLVVAR